VLLEIEQAPEQKKELLLDVIYKYKMKALESSEQINKLAQIYVADGIIP
jgi:hypothetical protein